MHAAPPPPPLSSPPLPSPPLPPTLSWFRERTMFKPWCASLPIVFTMCHKCTGFSTGKKCTHMYFHPPPPNTHTPTCLAYTSEDVYVLIYKVRLEVHWGPRSADPPKMVKHDVFGVFSQRFPRTRFWVLGRCRVLGVSWCFHMKVLGSISKANAHTHTHTPTHPSWSREMTTFRP